MINKKEQNIKMNEYITSDILFLSSNFCKQGLLYTLFHSLMDADLKIDEKC